mgnify:FL=1
MQLGLLKGRAIVLMGVGLWPGLTGGAIEGVMKRLLIAISLALPLASVSASTPPALAPGADYRLVWADEFDRPGLPDPAKWDHEIQANKSGWYNDEAQYYSHADGNNARVTGGRLLIEAKPGAPGSEGSRPADWGGQTYTSARLTSGTHGAITYGFVEVRARFSCGRGSWPAIWLLPVDPNREWPASGEIDVMEHVGADPGIVHQSIHTTKYNHIDKTQKTAVFPVKSACGAMHRYQLEWTPDRIRMGVDGQQQFDFAREPGRDAWPFDRPFRVILNVAVGGFWGGMKGIDPKAFPMRLEVDYVRIWQKR